MCSRGVPWGFREGQSCSWVILGVPEGFQGWSSLYQGALEAFHVFFRGFKGILERSSGIQKHSKYLKRVSKCSMKFQGIPAGFWKFPWVFKKFQF